MNALPVASECNIGIILAPAKASGQNRPRPVARCVCAANFTSGGVGRARDSRRDIEISGSYFIMLSHAVTGNCLMRRTPRTRTSPPGPRHMAGQMTQTLLGLLFKTPRPSLLRYRLLLSGTKKRECGPVTFLGIRLPASAGLRSRPSSTLPQYCGYCRCGRSGAIYISISHCS